MKKESFGFVPIISVILAIAVSLITIHSAIANSAKELETRLTKLEEVTTTQKARLDKLEEKINEDNQKLVEYLFKVEKRLRF